MEVLLFSYGTLQLKRVQIASFGRELDGFPAKVYGYRLEQLEILDEKVLETSNQKSHPIAIISGNKRDFINGMAFRISHAELLKADKYEVSDYKRVEIRLDSGQLAFMYVSAL